MHKYMCTVVMCTGPVSLYVVCMLYAQIRQLVQVLWQATEG